MDDPEHETTVLRASSAHRERGPVQLRAPDVADALDEATIVRIGERLARRGVACAVTPALLAHGLKGCAA